MCGSISSENYFVQIDIQSVASEEQHADILTKSLAASPFEYHRKFLMNLPLGDE